MSKPLTESYSIDLSEPDFVHIHHEETYDNYYVRESVKDLWFERQNLPYIIDGLRPFLVTQAPMSGIDGGHDSVSMREAGHDAWPLIAVDNLRPIDALHGGSRGFYISKELAATLLEELTTVIPTVAPRPPRRIWRHEYATHESHTVDESDPDFIHVRYVQVASDGTDMGGSMWFERSSLRYVVDALRACVTIVPPVPKADIGQDHFVLYRDHHGSPTLYGLENHRLLATPHGGNYTLLMGRGLTRRVVRDLAAVARRSGPAAGTRQFWDDAPPEAEACAIKASQPDFIRIRLKLVAGDSGLDLVQNLWFERANLPWLVDALRACLSRSDFEDARLEKGDDRLEVYRTDGEPVFINLFNDRPVRAPHGHMYFLSMTRPTARKLLRRLAWLSRAGRLKKLVGWPV
jgi:hypothetical protein